MELALGVDDVIHLTAVHPAVFGRLDLPAAAHDARRFLAGPGAVLLTQADAGTDQFVSGVAADSARSVEDAVAHVFEKVAAFGRFQFGTGQQLTRRSFGHVSALASALFHGCASGLRNVVLIRARLTRTQITWSAFRPVRPTRTSCQNEFLKN